MARLESMSVQSQSEYTATQHPFHALADPTRRTIIELLAANGQMSATDICENFTVSHPAVSQHLKVLREANLVHLEKDAQRRIYSLNPDTMQELEEWINRLTELWNERFARLDKVLQGEKKRKGQSRRGGD